MSELQATLGSAIESDTPQTNVKVSFTNIRYLDNSNNELKNERLIGRLSISQCKDYLKTNPDLATLIKHMILNHFQLIQSHFTN